MAKVSGRVDKIVHPLLEMVRKHSNEPEYAAAFFLALMWPCQSQRSGCELLTHPYLQGLSPVMVRHTGRPGMLNKSPRAASAFVAWCCCMRDLEHMISYVQNCVSFTVAHSTTFHKLLLSIW